MDGAAVAAHLRGELDLAEALELTDAQITALRDRAIALYRAEKYERCIQVVLGLMALERTNVKDAILLAESYRALGMTKEADACAAVRDQMIEAMS